MSMPSHEAAQRLMESVKRSCDPNAALSLVRLWRRTETPPAGLVELTSMAAIASGATSSPDLESLMWLAQVIGSHPELERGCPICAGATTQRRHALPRACAEGLLPNPAASLATSAMHQIMEAFARAHQEPPIALFGLAQMAFQAWWPQGPKQLARASWSTLHIEDGLANAAVLHTTRGRSPMFQATEQGRRYLRAVLPHVRACVCLVPNDYPCTSCVFNTDAHHCEQCNNTRRLAPAGRCPLCEGSGRFNLWTTCQLCATWPRFETVQVAGKCPRCHGREEHRRITLS